MFSKSILLFNTFKCIFCLKLKAKQLRSHIVFGRFFEANHPNWGTTAEMRGYEG